MYFQVFGFLIIAGALIALGKLCRSEDSLPSRLGLLVYIESAALAGIAVALVVPSDAVYNELALLTGVLIGLALTIWLAWQLGKLARQSATTFAN